jgi:Ras GTPase-activating-like protein IQGAP2/3
MSIYPPSSSQRRQASTASTSSLGSSLSTFSFPASRSTTVSSATSNSSRFDSLERRSGAPNRKHASSLEGASPMLSGYRTNSPTNEIPRPLTSTPSTPPRNGSPLGSNGSPLARGHVRGASVPAATATSPTSRPPPSPYNSAHRNSVIGGTSSLKKDDVKHLRNSSVSHFRTLSRLTHEGSAEEFGIESGEDVAGMHGRKRLQRTNTDNMTTWERMTWMDKRRQYIQAYEYLCHIGEAKEWGSRKTERGEERLDTCLANRFAQVDGGLYRRAHTADCGAGGGPAGRCCSGEADENIRPGIGAAHFRTPQTTVSTLRQH